MHREGSKGERKKSYPSKMMKRGRYEGVGSKEPKGGFYTHEWS